VTSLLWPLREARSDETSFGELFIAWGQESS